MTLSALAEQLDGELIGQDTEFSELSTDTRTLPRGALYLALQGEHFDGNSFVGQAQAQGAGAAIVAKRVESDLPMLRVADTHKALGQIASVNRSRSNATVIAITGSQGKTTVKEMLGKIIGISANTLITQANLNNTIGVPLTLLQLTENHGFAVIEMGANSIGEIAYSTGVTQPDIALITNANAAHIEGFGSIEGIVKAKGEIIEGLKEDGIILLNADEAHVQQWVQLAADRRIVFFSYSNGTKTADYFATDVSLNEKGQVSFQLISPKGDCRISMNLLGQHSVLNAVAASATAMEAGASLSDVMRGLTEMKPVSGRLCPLRGINGCLMIDDSYNASPSSFFAAIDVLMSFSGRKILVVGDMKEMGVETDEAHLAVGDYARVAGVEELLAVGEKSKFIVDAYGSHGTHFIDKAHLVEACRELARPESVLLVKGSRGASMESVVNELSTDEDF